MAKVIAISSVTGGGKTTTINALMDRLPNAMALYFDDYGFDENVDYGKWLAGGGDYNEWDLTALKNDLLEMIENPHIDYILLDYPFAYKNNQIKPYIDFAVYINTPLDVALVRQILRDMGNADGDDIRGYISSYVKYARPAFQYMLDTIPDNSDLIVDGIRSVDEIMKEILEQVK